MAGYARLPATALQMLGKLRLALAPALPEWGHVPLSLSTVGLTTGALATPSGAVEATLDLAAGAIQIASTGRPVRGVPISPARPIAEIWSDFTAALANAGVTATLWERPQERADKTPFSTDNRPRTYDAALALAWCGVVADANGWFDAWRSHFFGRSSVNFWWGGFDSSVVLFNGRHATPPADANLLGRHEKDAEQLSVGFWPGDSKRAPMFFGYIIPEPPGCPDYDLQVPGAAWDAKHREWLLPYELVRASDDAAGIVHTFMDAIYRAAGDLAGWDLAAFTYVAP